MAKSRSPLRCRVWQHATGLAVAASFVALLGGCAELVAAASAPRSSTATDGSRAIREAALSRTWAGKPRDELVRVWGQPRLVMHSPGFNEHRDALILVFFDRDLEGGCIDAFVVWQDDDETIATYFCR